MSVRAAAGGISAGTQAAFGVVSFANSNGISFGISQGTLTASGGGAGAGTLSAYAVGNTTGQSSSSSLAETLFSIDGAGAISVGLSAGSLIISAPNTVALTQFSAGISTGGNTSNNSGVVTALLVLAATNALTLSGSTNAGSMTITMSVPQTSVLTGVGGISISSAGSTISISAQQLSFVNALPQAVSSLTQVGHGSIQVYPFYGPEAFSASRADILFSNTVSSSSNSSHAGVLSVHIGLYTRNASTLSLASSASQSYQWTNTSNNSMASISGLRRASVPLNANFTGGDIWVAVLTLTSSTNANWFTASNVVVQPQMTGQLQGLVGEASNNTRQLMLGSGMWSTTTNAMPASIAFSAISGLGASLVNSSGYIYMSPVMFANATA